MIGATTAPTTALCKSQAICLLPNPSWYGIDLTNIPDPIMAAMETPIATIPCLATMFIIAGERKMATAVPAVTPKDAPKYMLVSRFCCLTRSLKKKSINSYSGYCMYLVLSFLKHFNSFILPFKEHVKQRIRDTYMYFGASLGVTAGTAVAIFRSPAMMNIVARQGMVATFIIAGERQLLFLQ